MIEVARESMEFDVVIVGAGPAGLSAACRIKQLCQEKDQDLSVCIIEKGSEVGAHILSGAVFEPRALTELFPNWQKLGSPVSTRVTEDVFYFLANAEKSYKIPGVFVPKPMRNEGNYVISLGNLCRWLAQQAEQLGVDVFPGFPAAQILYQQQGHVSGVVTGDMGVDRTGKHKNVFQPGVELRAKYTIFSEGCRGHLGKQLISNFSLNKDSEPQHYGIGIKEIWRIDPISSMPGLVIHTLGWPLDNHTEGGGFLYHLDDNQVALGFIVALNYTNPHLDPFEEMQRWKTHPTIRRFLEGATRVGYGARALNKGGLQSVPKLSFPGGLLAGCEAGFLNGAKIKGNHTAMKSGMLAGEAVFESLTEDYADGVESLRMDEKFKASWIYDELYQARNYGPLLQKFGTALGGALVWLDQNVFSGRMPFTLHNPTADHACLKKSPDCPPINYPKPDGVITFDRLSSVFLSSTNHEENQPCHLKLEDPGIPVSKNLPEFNEPATRYCPAGVYEVVDELNGEKRFQINAQNCVHCKTCDIKDPAQNITWTVPEGGGGPNYSNM